MPEKTKQNKTKLKTVIGNKVKLNWFQIICQKDAPYFVVLSAVISFLMSFPLSTGGLLFTFFEI